MRHVILLLALAFAGPTYAAPSADSSQVTAAKKKKGKKKRKARKGKKRKRKRSKKAKKKGPLDVQLNIGFGPALHMITGPVQDDQTVHYGVKLYMKAIIDEATIKANLHRVPKKYRGMFRNTKELRIGHLLIPDTLFISPRTKNTAMYGISWRPLALELPLSRAPRFAVGLGLDITYAYLNTRIDDAETTTHFLRPGLDLTASFEVPLSRTFLVDIGWASAFYPPQEIGGDIFALGEVDESIWHIGQAFLRFHFRTPYQVNL